MMNIASDAAANADAVAADAIADDADSIIRAVAVTVFADGYCH